VVAWSCVRDGARSGVLSSLAGHCLSNRTLFLSQRLLQPTLKEGRGEVSSVALKVERAIAPRDRHLVPSI
jgi:hypothetical protein